MRRTFMMKKLNEQHVNEGTFKKILTFKKFISFLMAYKDWHKSIAYIYMKIKQKITDE